MSDHRVPALLVYAAVLAALGSLAYGAHAGVALVLVALTAAAIGWSE